MREKKRLETALATESELARRSGDIDCVLRTGARRRRCVRRLAPRDRRTARHGRQAGDRDSAFRPERRTQCHRDHSSRRRRNRVAGLGRDAHAHVPALGRARGLLDADVRIPAGRRSGHQVRDLRRERRLRLRTADQRNRRASPGAHLALRPGQAAPHLVRQRLCLAGDRREHRDRHQARRHSHRHVSLRRQGRAARQHHRFRRAHHAHSHGNRGGLPERAFAAQEQREGDEHSALAALRVRAGEEESGDQAHRRFQARHRFRLADSLVRLAAVPHGEGPAHPRWRSAMWIACSTAISTN